MPNFMTRKAYNHLRARAEEIARLTGKGGELTREIGEAAGHGDLSENAEWQMARARRDILLSEAELIRQRLAGVEIIDDWEISTARVAVGTKVRLLDLDSDTELCYQILGSDDTSHYEHAISVNSPLARGLLGAEEGDARDVAVPSGVRRFEVLSIERFG